MFNQPQDTNTGTAGGYFRPADNDGDLILFETVIEAGREFDQMAGAEREFRVVTYVNIDRDCTPVTGKVTHIALVRKLPVGATNILGRIGKTKTSNGYNAWVLNPFQPADAVKAKAWIDGGRKPAIDPFAADERTANAAGVTAKQLAELRKLGLIPDDTPAF